MNFQKSLFDGIEYQLTRGAKIGVVVVDEQSDQHYSETSDQRKCIDFAVKSNFPVWLVELNPGTGPTVRTSIYLRGMLPPATSVITKATLNAFHKTGLRDRLNAKGIDTIILMGYASNQCVRITSVGGHLGQNNTGEYTMGALQHGFLVMTCQQILRGGPASWATQEGVEFFSSLY